MTEIETGEGKLYLATVIDLFSRRLLGYAVYNSRRLHSVCGFKSPIDYEHDYWASLGEGLAA